MFEFDEEFDEDALIAAIDLVGRSGATALEFGYLHDQVPIEDAAWWAHAQYRGARITVEEKRSPIDAVEALARRVLLGAKCVHCGGLVTLSDAGVLVRPGSPLVDGTSLPTEPSELIALGQCRWRRVGRRWARGCEGRPDMRQRKVRKKRRR